MKRLHIALVYNGHIESTPELAEDRAGTADLRQMIRHIARTLRRLGHTVTILPLVHDLFAFQRKLRRLQPDVIFNQYDDVVHGALYEMRLAALVPMMGFPMTGSPALALGLGRYKYMSASLLFGAGIPIPPNTAMLETVSSVDHHKWQFPIIVQPSQEHAGIGLDRDSVVYSKKALRLKVRQILHIYKQPALAQRFLPGREFNVGIIGGNRPRSPAPGGGMLCKLASRDSTHHVLRGQVGRNIHGIPADQHHLPGRSGAGAGATDQPGSSPRFSRWERAGMAGWTCVSMRWVSRGYWK